MVHTSTPSMALRLLFSPLLRWPQPAPHHLRGWFASSCRDGGSLRLSSNGGPRSPASAYCGSFLKQTKQKTENERRVCSVSALSSNFSAASFEILVFVSSFQISCRFSILLLHFLLLVFSFGGGSSLSLLLLPIPHLTM